MPPLPLPPPASDPVGGPDQDRDPGADARAALVARTVAWFGENRRDLPWRSPDRTPWGVLVSEVMLQQTPVVRVTPVWTAWMERWPTPRALAEAGTADVLRAWGRLGYPRRALRLQDCARAVTDRHGGVVPTDEAALLALPGVGAYTAAAVVAFAHGGRSVVLDTNVRRVIARAVRGEALPAPAQTAAEVRGASALVPDAAPDAAAWAAASMELGAVVCTARSPRCGDCPVAELCRWRAAGYPADLHADRRRAQGWAGTDRQVRGHVMGLLRDSPRPVPVATVAARWPDDAQLHRCLDALVSDGLVQRVGPDDAPALRLPA